MTVGILLASVLGWWAAVPSPWAVPDRLSWALPGLVVLVVLAEVTQLRVEIRRQTVSLSLSELPLVLGLFLLDPLSLLVARVLTGVAVCVRRGAAAHKVAFNSVLFAMEVTVASAVFDAVRGDATTGPQVWLAAYAATVTVSVLTGALLLVAVGRLQGAVPRSDVGVWLWPLVLGAAMTTSAALVALVVGQADARAVALLLLLALVLAGGYRVYGRLLHRHQVLQLLQSFTAALGGGGSAASLLSASLRHARALLAADVAQVVIAAPGGGGVRALRQRSDDERVSSDAECAGVVAEVLATGAPRRLVRGTTDPVERGWLLEQQLRDAVVVPITGPDGVHGTLLVGQRLGETSSFGQDDVDLLEMVATHLEIALRSADLVERLQHEATHDALTGLPNRTLFTERLTAAIDGRRPGSEFAVLLMDLDGFKDVNDTLGHECGDQVLVEVARRLLDALPEDVTVARLGGDEFCLLVPLGAGRPDVTAVVDRLHSRLRVPYAVGDVELEVRASVGAALCPQHGDDGSVLLRHADVAMYAGKAAQLPLQVYGADIDRSNPRRLALVNDLRAAVSDGLLVCHYQPKVRVEDTAVTGVEALVRWQHPVLGNVPPDDFIPIAEHTGVIVPLTSFVLRTALEQSAGWSALGYDLDVAVNVSPRALLSPSFLEEVAGALRDTGVPARRLTLEVTESSVMTDPTRAIAVLQALHALGVQLSVDDFGTGYSSLAYLQRLPVDEVKIDKSFVRDLAVAAGDGAIVRAIVDLGHNLGLRVVAEGVEDARSMTVLRDMGCDTAQGYLVSRPLPPDRLLTWLSTSAGAPVVPGPRQPALGTTAG